MTSAEGSSEEPKNGLAPSLTGVKEGGTCTRGTTRNLGDPDTSTKERRGKPAQTPGHGEMAPDSPGSEGRVSVVAPGEGDGAWREECQGVGVLRSTAEAGERSGRTLWREGGTSTWNRSGER